MTIIRDLFLAILSMDSYNRGYNSGFGGNDAFRSSTVGTTAIGDATIVFNVDGAGLLDSAEALNFYAIAYDYNGERVFAYRGTDDPLGFRGDVVTGWAIGAGRIENNQASLAR